MRRLRTLVWRLFLAGAKAAGPTPHRFVWAEVDLLKRGPRVFARWNAMLAAAWARDRVNRRRYRHLGEEELRAERRSDTVFIFGCGASLNDIEPDEWEAFRRHDVLGINAFYRQQWIPVDFHILRGAVYGELRWRPFADEVASTIAGNPLYRDTILLLQEGFLSQHGNQLVGYRLLPEATRIGRYRSFGTWAPPTRSLAEGLRAVVGTLDAAVNLAYVLGWRSIVLVGVDLYDARYFWLPPDETIAVDTATARPRGAAVGVHGLRPNDRHFTAESGEVQLLKEWTELLAREGVSVAVYNPRSLLTDAMPVFDRTPLLAAGAPS